MSEQSSAGGRDPRKVTGVFLVLAGALLFLLQMTTGITVSLMLLVVGIAFIAAYYNRRTYGMLVPGCILVGMGLGQLGEEYVTFIQDPTFTGLGLGFLAIYVVDRIHRGATEWWPLVPGFILLFIGLEPGGINIGKLLSNGWPLALVVLGLLYLAGKIGSPPGGSAGDDAS